MTDTTSAAPSLLPCPFCGGINIIHCGHHMYCHACGADGPDADTQYVYEATEYWNRRVPAVTPSDEDIDAHVDLFRWDTTEGRRALVRAALACWRGAPAAHGDAERLDFMDTADSGAIRLDDRTGLVPQYVYWGPHHKAKTARAAIDAARAQAKEGAQMQSSERLAITRAEVSTCCSMQTAGFSTSGKA